MEENNATPNQPQHKKAFVIHASPAWLDQHQDWISDGARQLYKALRSLANQKTGQLLIPGKGWIRLRTVELKAGMSEDTRLKYTKELIALGCYHVHRERVPLLKNGREREVLGQAEITISPLEPKPHGHSRSSTPGTQKTNTGAGSSTPGNADNKETEPQSTVSSTPGTENILLHPDSSTVEGSGCQKMSEITIDLPSVSSVPLAVENNCPNKAVDCQDSPAATPTATGSIKPPVQEKPKSNPLTLDAPINDELIAAFKANPAGLNSKQLVGLLYGFVPANGHSFYTAQSHVGESIKKLRSRFIIDRDKHGVFTLATPPPRRSYNPASVTTEDHRQRAQHNLEKLGLTDCPLCSLPVRECVCKKH